MKLYEAERYVRDQLKLLYDEREAGNIADLVVEHCTGFRRIDRLTRKEEVLPDEVYNTIQDYVQRLLKHEPVQYVLHTSWFYGMKLYVDNDVLIPRPETEELVDWIISDVKKAGLDVFERRPAQADVTTELKILDVGTGSGCIALALKKSMPKAEVWACDVSDRALNVARRNGSLLNIRIDFVGMNFLNETEHKQLPSVDIIASNPPYIPLRDKDSMHPNVVNYEPHTALFVPDNDALVFYKAIAQYARHRLHPGGRIYLEIHEDLGKQVVSLFQQEGYAHVELKKDMQGKDRMVKIST
jgi:release factor glutamine methyltransferase